MTRRTLLPGLALLCLVSAPALAVEPLDADSLKKYCSAESSDADAAKFRFCLLYVNGFLDGAVATDERVAKNVVDEIERDESLQARAVRTRIIRRLGMTGPTGYAEFCVGQPVPIVEVVAHVLEELDRYESLEDVKAQDVVYASLRRHYPC